MDGLTTNGVLVMHPEGFPQDPKQGLWREISVCGDVYALRETRSGPSRGKLVSHLSDGLLRRSGLGRIVGISLSVCRQKGRAAHCGTAPWWIFAAPLCCGAPGRD